MVPTKVSKETRLLIWCLVLASVASLSGPVSAGGGPRNVLVVVNGASQISSNVGSYYAKARSIPASNILTINCATDEVVSRDECETNIVAPIRSFLQTSPIAGKIDYIVLTKEIPLAANYGFSTGPASVTSVLTCVGEPSVTGTLVNPFGPLASPLNCAFSHQLDFAGKHYYLVTRLDGYTQQDIFNLIDRSQGTYSGAGVVMLDGTGQTSPTWILQNDLRLVTANATLQSRGIATLFDDTPTFLGGTEGLLGYFSWGSNDPSYNATQYLGNRFLPGSIADSYVSTSGRTFAAPQSTGQSLMADLIPLGACAVSGFVSEPMNSRCSRPDILFDRYTNGYNVAESFFAACPQLYWKAVLVADPLMAPFAARPAVAILQPQPPVLDVVGPPAPPVTQIILTGQSTLLAEASSPSGISRVEYYLDDKFVGSATQVPYVVAVDTTLYAVGPHTAEAIAYDSSPMATQGSTKATVVIENLISNLAKVSDAFSSTDGQGVKANSRIVIAASSDMGGEFYVEDPDRAAGIKVVSSASANEGDVVTIVGRMGTQGGERCIIADTVQVISTGQAPGPLGMPNMAIGGSAAGPQTPGVTGATGLRNMGLLVRTWGKVTYAESGAAGFFYLDDGNGLADGSGHTGVKVQSRGLATPAVGAQATVTGVSACEIVGDRVNRVIKIRKASDVTVAEN